MKYRIEKDLLGELQVPDERYYGIHTARALKNFHLSEKTTLPALTKAMAMVKMACARTNGELKYLEKIKADTIISVCNEIIAGKLADEFAVDALQGGAGTSTNMNINEVIANRALELLGHPKGDYAFIHPLEHVNLHQSTNDVYPTAVKIAVITELRKLSEKIAVLQDNFQNKEKEFADIVKIGRTEMQDAVPLTLGAEFSAFAEAFARDRWRTFKAEERIRLVNLGGTAIGTGLTAPKRYIFMVIEKLRDITGFGLARGENCVDQTANLDSFVEVCGIMQACSVNFEKICRDLRQLHFIGEIILPPVQAGSSIMPGKINPVIMECIIQGSRKVRSLNRLVEDCAAAGTLQINEYLPLIADSILESLVMLENMADMLSVHVMEIKADKVRCADSLNRSVTLITAFLPNIGYEQATQLVNEFTVSGKSDFRDFLSNKLGDELVNKTLSPHNLISLGYKD
ncbi:MAG: aspartate ammonia-lyase [Victivallaceae bacterium]